MKFWYENYKIYEILTYKKFLRKYNLEDEFSVVPDKVYDVDITLRNINADDTTGIDLAELSVQGPAVYSSIDANLLSQANPSLKGSNAIALRKRLLTCKVFVKSFFI